MQKKSTEYLQSENMIIAFANFNKETVKKVVASFSIPSLEYSAEVWNSHMKKRVEKTGK